VHTIGELKTAMFLLFVAGGDLLLFITRSERWFFQPPFPAMPLFLAIVATQLIAVLMCALGLLMEPIPSKLIGVVWLYNIAWMCVLGGERVATGRFADFRTAWHAKRIALVNQLSQPAAAAATVS
jgi:H+-transporting ATPase